MNNKIRITTIVLFAVFLFISCGGGGENKKIKIAYANCHDLYGENHPSGTGI